jgi:hypothetical protein
MKKSGLLIIFFLITSVTRAQNYIPMLDSVSNTWYFAWNVIPVRLAQVPNCSYPLYPTLPSWTYATVFDTAANGYTYKAIGKQDYGAPFLDCIAGYLREDTAAQKVYFMDNQFGVEELLYDFSMVPGDSILLNFASNGFYQNGMYVLDSIRNITLETGIHRIFFLNNPLNFFLAQLQWIEGVGNPGNLLYTKAENFGGGMFANVCWPPDMINRNGSDLLTCFYQGPEKIYFDSCSHSSAIAQQGSPWFSYVDSCVYWSMAGSVEEINGLTSLLVVPNPAGDHTSILAEALIRLEGELIIRDIFGRPAGDPKKAVFIPGSNAIPLDTRKLDSGIYLVEFRTSEGSMNTRLVIGR